MKYVKIEHLVLFYNDRIERRIKKKADAKIEYGKQKLVYESKFFPKLFGWKFENSYHGDLSWMGSWNFRWDDEAIKSFRKNLTVLDYHEKCGEILGELDPYHADAFYSYCEKTRIPY